MIKALPYIVGLAEMLVLAAGAGMLILAACTIL
jgi:hypothetical protein